MSDQDRAAYLAAQLHDLRLEMIALRAEFRRELVAQHEEFRRELYRLRRRDEQAFLRASSQRLERDARITGWLLGVWYIRHGRSVNAVGALARVLGLNRTAGRGFHTAAHAVHHPVPFVRL